MSQAKKPKMRHAVVEEPEGCFRVYDREKDAFVDGPFSREELAEARAAKREGRVTVSYGWAAQHPEGTDGVPPLN